MSRQLTVGEALVARLEAYGVDTIFGIPGVHTIEMYRGLKTSRIRHVTPRHEQGAGFMADGYARATGKPGVALIISGPGVTNILTAMGQAYGDSVPMLVLSSVNAHGRMGSGEGWLHELQDQSATAAGVAAFSRTIHRPEEMAVALDQAFAVFQSGRPRPVHLEFPIDLLSMPAPEMPPVPAPLAQPEVPARLLDEAAALLNGARAPLIVAGGGASGPIRELAEALDAPVVMTANARGRLGAGHPLGVPVSPSLPPVRELIAAADVVLALGTEMGSTDYDWNEDGGLRIPGKLIRVDIDPLQIRRSRGCPVHLGLVGDAGAAAGGLLARIAPRPSGEGAARAAKARGDFTAQASKAIRGDLAILGALRDALPGVIFAGDSTQLTYAGIAGYDAAAPRTFWTSATGFGTLGYGLPGAIGAALGQPDRPVIALAGDGGYLFTVGEMAAATEAKARVIVLLHDNGGYGEIKTNMLLVDVAPLGVDLVVPDFVAMARSYGWQAVEAETPEALIDACKAATTHDGPTLIRFTDAVRAGFQPQ